jgi:flagellar biosynthesis/type III secretory pathway chaperone
MREQAELLAEDIQAVIDGVLKKRSASFDDLERLEAARAKLLLKRPRKRNPTVDAYLSAGAQGAMRLKVGMRSFSG